MFMSYTKKTWVDGSAGGTPITASELNRMENGIATVDSRVENGFRPTTVSPETFGAVGDGVANDQTALQNWLNALGPGKVGVLTDNRTYAHSGVLSISVPDTLIRGSRSAVLLSTAPGTSSLRVNANRVTVEDITHRHINVTERLNALDNHSFASNAGFTDMVWRRCISEGSPGVGFFVFGCTRFLMEDCINRRSRADNFHITYGSTDGLVVRAQALFGGDDGVAIVSYDGDPTPVERVRIVSPRIHGQFGSGRGVAVVGGNDIWFTDVYAKGTHGAGIYLGTEVNQFYVTRPTTNVRVDGAHLIACNQSNNLDHGAVFILSEDLAKPVSNIAVNDVVVQDQRNYMHRVIVNNGATVSNVTFNRFHASGSSGEESGSANTSDGWTISGETNGRAPIVRRLTADFAKSDTATQTPGQLLFYPTTAGVYLLEVRGRYVSSATTAGLQIGVQGNVNSIGLVKGWVEQRTSATASTVSLFDWAQAVGVAPAASGTEYAFDMQAHVEITAFPIRGGNLGPIVRPAGAGTLTLKAGTWARLTRIA